MRILFITATRIGDAVLSTGILDHLYKKYPEAKFTIAAGEAATPLFQEFPGLHKLIPLKKRVLALHWLSLWDKVGLPHWDIVVDLRRSGIRYFLWADKVYLPPKSDGSQHKLKDLSNMMGRKTPFDPVLWTSPNHDQNAKELLAGEKFVLALGPTANWKGKQWAVENYARLAKALTKEEGLFAGAKVAIFGTEAERPLIKGLLDSIPNTKRIDLVGKTDLLTSFCVLKKCAFFIGNDTGIMHVAAAAGVPTLGLFGPSNENIYSPWGANTAVVRTDLSMEEIVNDDSFDHTQARSYMRTLSVEKVLAATEKLVRKVKKHQSEKQKKKAA